MSALPKARSDVTRLRKELAKREADVEAAREKQTMAEVAYDSADDKDAAADAAARARLARESAERLLVGARTALATASKALADLEHEALTDVFEGERATLAGWASTLDLSGLVELERQLDAAILALVVKCAEMSDLHATASEHAVKLGRRDLAPAVGVAELRVVVQRALAAARDRDQRDTLSAWLGNPPDYKRWELKDMPAATLLENVAFAEHTAAKAAHDDVLRRGILAGANAVNITNGGTT